MGIPTLISTNTADSITNLYITSGLDGTYDEYMFVMTDFHPETDNNALTFQVSTNGGTSYSTTNISTHFAAHHSESGTYSGVAYVAGDDETSTGAIYLGAGGLGGAADESLSGILHIFSPANTTYVKNWYARTNEYYVSDYSKDTYVAGYFNTTSAVDAIFWQMAAGGDMSGVVQLYGIA